MKHKPIFLFWFALLALALVNATIREFTYKPLLEPHIGIWAHQISSLTGIILFFGAIYYFFKKNSHDYSNTDLLKMGLIWMGMTLVFEVFMNMYIRHLSWQEVLHTYYFWQGETWIFVLLSLIISPFIANKIIKQA